MGGAEPLKKRIVPALFAVVLALLCLTTGCSADDPPAAPAHEGTWYFAQNAVECHIVEGKIYQDDLKSKEGQSLRGVYSEMDDYIEANLAGVGGVQTPRTLYVVQTDAGEVLCDSADGTGTVYFYRDALAALAAVEGSAALEPAVSSNRTPAPAALASPSPESNDPAPEDAPSRSMPGLDDDPSSEAQSTPSTGSGSMVWIPQSGSKYHRTSSCSGMKNPTQISQTEAESKGYTPCKRCY